MALIGRHFSGRSIRHNTNNSEASRVYTQDIIDYQSDGLLSDKQQKLLEVNHLKKVAKKTGKRDGEIRFTF